MLDSHTLAQPSTSGRWSKQEHLRFLQGLQLYGRNWKEISKYVATRNGAQIRSHAQKYFNKFSKAESGNDSTEVKEEKLCSSLEQSSAPQQETNVCSSYYFIEISKLVTERIKLDFWGQLIDIKEQKTSAGRTEQLQKLKTSFIPFKTNSDNVPECVSQEVQNI